MTIIAPSLLAADFLHLQQEVDMFNQSNAEWLHYDVMDGRFVPNISFGIPVLESVRKATAKFIDVHLMIEKPEHLLAAFKNAGADNITIHYETCPNLLTTVNLIKELGATAGVAINPDTPVSVLKEILPHVKVVCVMSVYPGFGGQKFIPHTLNKITELRQMIDAENLPTLIEIDGGVTVENAPEILAAGAHVLVAGNTVFRATNPIEIIEKLLAN